LFQTEKQLKEVGEKIPADKKAAIESALAELKSAKESNNIEAMDAASEKLNAAWQAASQDIYNATQGAQPGAGEPTADNATGETVSDVEYEEVKDNK
jgi:molecular chaperone DnaK